MERFKTNSKNKLKKIFFIFLAILLILYMIKGTSLSSFIIYSINDKITNNFSDKKEISNRLIYSSLNKIVEYKDTVVKTEEMSVKNSSIKPTIHKDKKNNYKVYIYNSHQTEEYSLKFESNYSISPTVYHASYILKEHLKDNGIDATVEDESVSKYLKKHNLNYLGCYDATRSFIKKATKTTKYDSIIDLHRDSASKKYSTYTKNNKKYARIMFVVSMKHKNYKKNLAFVEKLNNYINKNYKGLGRGIYKREDVIFNQDLNDKAILIEIGGVDNTIEEVNNTLEVFAYALSKYIGENYGS